MGSTTFKGNLRKIYMILQFKYYIIHVVHKFGAVA